jgi:hypothetical protein
MTQENKDEIIKLMKECNDNLIKVNEMGDRLNDVLNDEKGDDMILANIDRIFSGNKMAIQE